MDNQDKKLEKLNKMFELLKEDTLTPKEVEQFLTLILGVIKSSKDHFETISKDNLKKIDEAMERLESVSKNEFENKIAEIRAIVSTKPKDGYTPKKGVDYRDGEDADPNVVAPIAAVMAVEEIKPLIPTIEDIEADLPKLGLPIRDALELLPRGEDGEPDERLDAKAIKGLEELEEKISKNIDSRALSIVENKTRFLINKVSDLQSQVGSGGSGTGGGHIIEDEGVALTQRAVLNFTGSGVEVTDTGGKTTVTIDGSGGTANAYAETPSGTVNSSNVTFTLAHTPADTDGVIVLLDGVTQYNGVDYTVSGDTITFSTAPVTGSTIFAYYNTFVSGGTAIENIIAGNNIDVDATDPANPIVSVETLTLADISDVTASVTEVNYVDGVTSAIQTQLDAKIDGLGVSGEIPYWFDTDTIGSLSTATYPNMTELSRVKGVTSAIQTQLDGKQPLDSDLTTIAGLTATTDNFIVSVASAWASRTPAQVRATLDLEAGTDFYSIAAADSAISGAVSTHAALTATHGATGAVVGTTNTQVLTNKAITKRVVTTTDDATAVIDVAVTDVYQLTAIANNTTFSFTGSPTDGQKFMIRYKDAGVSKTLAWTGFTAIGITLPTSTTAGKWGYVGVEYNAAAGEYHAIATQTQA